MLQTHQYSITSSSR